MKINAAFTCKQNNIIWGIDFIYAQNSCECCIVAGKRVEKRIIIITISRGDKVITKIHAYLRFVHDPPGLICNFTHPFCVTVYIFQEPAIYIICRNKKIISRFYIIHKCLHFSIIKKKVFSNKKIKRIFFISRIFFYVVPFFIKGIGYGFHITVIEKMPEL